MWNIMISEEMKLLIEIFWSAPVRVLKKRQWLLFSYAGEWWNQNMMESMYFAL